MAIRMKNWKRIGAVIAACLVCAALAPSIALAADGKDNDPQPASEKNETVRIFADATGKPLNVEVQTILRNGNGDSFLLDETDLTDIVPKDDCGYTVDNADLIWQADGLDVTYTGETAKEAPVGVSVTYTLDGKNVSPSELAGASGHVTIHYDYVNNAIIDGTATPFMMITGLLLDDSKFSNVTVKNGKIISDENRTIVVGYALPGMQTSLELDKEDMELPAYFEIEADVTDFELNASLTMASTDLFDGFSNDDIDISELSESADELSDAMGEIIDAASEFRDGLKELDKGAKSLSEGFSAFRDLIPAMVNGIRELSTGSQELSAGLQKAADGTDNLETGTKGVAGGIDYVIYGDGASNIGLDGAVKGAEKLNVYAEKLIDGLKEATDESLPAAQEAAQQLATALSDEGISTLVAVMSGAVEELNADSSAIAAIKTQTGNALSEVQATQAAIDNIDTSGITDPDLKAAIDAQIAQAQTKAQSAYESVSCINTAAADISTDATSGAINEIQASQESLSKASAYAKGIADGIGEAISSLKEALSGAEGLSQGIEKLIGGLEQAVKGLKELSAYAQEMAKGATELNNVMPSIVGGAGQLEQGLSGLDENTGQLQSGVDQLADGAKRLQEGTESAASGSEDLLEGLQTYNDEGIQEIVNKIKVDLQGFVDRFLASADLGRAYDNFAGKAEGTPSSVKFVFELEGISAEA